MQMARARRRAAPALSSALCIRLRSRWGGGGVNLPRIGIPMPNPHPNAMPGNLATGSGPVYRHMTKKHERSKERRRASKNTKFDYLLAGSRTLQVFTEAAAIAAAEQEPEQLIERMVVDDKGKRERPIHSSDEPHHEISTAPAGGVGGPRLLAI